MMLPLGTSLGFSLFVLRKKIKATQNDRKRYSFVQEKAYHETMTKSPYFCETEISFAAIDNWIAHSHRPYQLE